MFACVDPWGTGELQRPPRGVGDADSGRLRVGASGQCAGQMPLRTEMSHGGLVPGARMGRSFVPHTGVPSRVRAAARCMHRSVAKLYLQPLTSSDRAALVSGRAARQRAVCSSPLGYGCIAELDGRAGTRP